MAEKFTSGGEGVGEDSAAIKVKMDTWVDEINANNAKNSYPSGDAAKVANVPSDTTAELAAKLDASAALALGETSATAYRGDRGKTAYDHSQESGTNPHAVTASSIGALETTGTGTVTASQTVSANRVVQLQSDGTWKHADKGAASTAKGRLAFATSGGSDGATIDLVFFGGAVAGSWTASSYFLDDAGAIVSDTSGFANGDQLRLVGYGSSDGALKYMPDGMYATVGGHASTHTDGTDDIQSATNAQKGLATAAHIAAIEANTAKNTYPSADAAKVVNVPADTTAELAAKQDSSTALALGETSTTAYRGDRGKTAYDHSQESGNPHGATTANIADSADKRYVTDTQLARLTAAATPGSSSQSSAFAVPFNVNHNYTLVLEGAVAVTFTDPGYNTGLFLDIFITGAGVLSSLPTINWIDDTGPTFPTGNGDQLQIWLQRTNTDTYTGSFKIIEA